MNPWVVWSERADSDLAEIQAFICDEAGDKIATRFIERIQRSAENLAYFTGIGSTRRGLAAPTRLHAVRPWVLVYEPLAEGHGIEILRVIDGRRPIETHWPSRR